MIILLTLRFQDKLGQVMASVGTVCAIGCMVGPVVGGALFDATEGLGPAWRFRMPFLFCSACTLVITAWVHRLVPQEYLSGEGPGGETGGGAGSSMLAVVTPSVAVNLIAVALSGTAVATLDPTLPYRLSAPPFNFSATVVSAFILGSSLVYVGVSIPIGWLVDRYTGRSALFKVVTGSGFLALAVSFTLLAPLRIASLDGMATHAGLGGDGQLNPHAASSLARTLGLSDSVPALVVAMAIKGVGSALSNNAVYPDLVIGFPSDDDGVQAKLSALWNAAYALGWALGPLAGGWLYDALAKTPLCTGDELTACGYEWTPASTTGAGGDLKHDDPDDSATVVASCSCDWVPDNGFDGFGTVIALASVAFAVVCFCAASMRRCNGAPPRREASSEIVSASSFDHSLSSPSPREDASRGVTMGGNRGVGSSADLDEESELNALLLMSTGPPSRWAVASSRTAPKRLVLSKAPSHRSLTAFKAAASASSSSIITSVDAALEKVGLGWFHFFTLPVLCFASMAQSLQTNLLSYMQPCAGASFGIEHEEIGSLSAVVFLTSAIATPAFGVLADAYGRKPATALSLTLMVVANVGSAMAPSFGVLCGFQALAGLGLGGTMVPFDLLAELSPPSIRGGVLNVSNWMWSVGTMIVALVAAYCVSAGTSGWRLLISVVNFPMVFTLCLAPLLSESPHWLMQRGHHARAVQVLRTIARANGVALPQRDSSRPPSSRSSAATEGATSHSPTSSPTGIHAALCAHGAGRRAQWWLQSDERQPRQQRELAPGAGGGDAPQL